MISPAVYRAVKRQADLYRVPLPHLLAFVEVEANGAAFDPVAGHDRALIRWEGHYFRERLKRHPDALDAATRAGLAGAPGQVRNPSDQAGRYALLDRAARLCCDFGLDPDLAYECISIGLGQVMGAHARRLGYPSARAMLDEAHNETPEQDIEDQVVMVVRYLEANGLLPAARAGDWDALGRGYNGPQYKRWGYDKKMAAAAARYAGAATPGQDSVLPPGGGPAYAVQEVQRRLHELGYRPGAVDGVFGRATQHAVLAFQSDNSLEPDGIVGPLTWAKLRAPTAVGGPLSAQRRDADVRDLRAKGSRTVRDADLGQVAAGTTIGAGAVAEAGGALANSVQQAQGAAWQIRSVIDTARDLCGEYWPFVLIAAGGAALYYFHRVKQARLADHRSGRNMGR